jgi:ribosomal protein L32
MLKTVSEEVKLQRLSICNSCEDFSRVMKICKQCGCYAPAKAMFAAAMCPSEKWLQAAPGQDLINKIEEMIIKSWSN